jgi:inhibitor of cysteine peptidase
MSLTSYISFMKKFFKILIIVLLFFSSVALVSAGIFFLLQKDDNDPNPPDDTTRTTSGGVVAFTSVEDFKQYLSEGESQSYLYGMGFSGGISMDAEVSFDEMGAPAPTTDSSTRTESLTPSRVSETNVQVQGIDEPDIVKTDGTHIYYSEKENWVYRGLFQEPALMEMDDVEKSYPGQPETETKILSAFPPETLEQIGQVDTSGDLLLHEDTLVVINYSSITGYDVSDPQDPNESWSLDIDGNSSVISARLFNGSMYLVMSNLIDVSAPCPIIPLTISVGAYSTITCSDIYHPRSIVPVNTTYTVFKIDPETGTEEGSTAFAGQSGSSLVYMSAENLYITYSYFGEVADLMIDFFYQADDVFPESIRNRLLDLKNLDISMMAKMTEIQVIMEEYSRGLDADEELELETKIENAWETYAEGHVRDFERTGIVKIPVSSLTFDGSAEIPGRPLNQFSLDEYEGYLRVATTSGDFWGFSDVESVNDVYVLDGDLEEVGSVLGMGITERIYSVRFIRDAGYVVTFRQIDPFYVLDLSNPRAPDLEGELKIPGYSSYLHPLSDTLILGVGEDGGQVKMTLFDVSDPTNPVEKDTYKLEEYWTEISQTHHAFLLDAENDVFFIPGGNAAYFFSYDDDGMELVKAVSDIAALRAVYIDEYMYVIGRDKIVVLDEKTWERVEELSL